MINALIFLRKKVGLYGLCLGLTAAFIEFGGMSAYGQVVDLLDVQRQQRQTLQRQQELRQEAPSQERSQRVATASQGSDAVCFPIDRIKLVNVTALSAASIKEAISPFEGKCLGLNAINAVVRNLTYQYIEKGLIAARVYIPEQDLSSGTLKLAALEGALEQISWPNAKRRGLTSRIATAFPNLKGKPLHLRDIEQGLDQIRRMRSSTVRNQVSPGSQPGHSILTVDEQNSRRIHGTLVADNMGQENTGLFGTRGTLTIDNLLQLNDVWDFGFDRFSPELGHFGAETHYSHALSGSVSVPYGYWTASLSVNWSNYENEIDGLLIPVDTDGTSAQAKASLARVIHRDESSKTSLTGSLTWKQTENYLLGVRLDTASRNLAIASVDLDHTRRMWGGVWAGTLSYYQGLNAFDAPNDALRDEGFPEAQFSKLSLAMSASYDFALANRLFSYSGSLSAQWSDDLLFGSEQFSLGGYYSVRGVRSGIAFGNIGALFRHEISTPIAVPEHWSASGAIEKITPYVGVDFGWIAGQDEFEIDSEFVMGGTIGLRADGKHLSFEMSYSDLLSDEDDAIDSGVFALKTTLRF